MRYICGACHAEIETHEKRNNYTYTCECGRKHTIEGRTVVLSTMRCACGVVIINEGKEGWIEHPNKDEPHGERKEVQVLQQSSGIVG